MSEDSTVLIVGDGNASVLRLAVRFSLAGSQVTLLENERTVEELRRAETVDPELLLALRSGRLQATTRLEAARVHDVVMTRAWDRTPENAGTEGQRLLDFLGEGQLLLVHNVRDHELGERVLLEVARTAEGVDVAYVTRHEDSLRVVGAGPLAARRATTVLKRIFRTVDEASPLEREGTRGHASYEASFDVVLSNRFHRVA